MTLARAQIRQAVVAALQAAVPNVLIRTSGDLPIPETKTPAITVRTAGDRKDSVEARGGWPRYRTLVIIEVNAVATATTDAGAQDAIEALGDQIEISILTAPGVIVLVDRISSVTTEQRITAEGTHHAGTLKITVVAETFEEFEPVPTQALTEIDVTVQTGTDGSISLHIDPPQ